ncbi:MAG: hypothetical protein ACK50P_06610 [Planctomycetaceae bacterium]|jgi:hypothetical protein
MAVSSLVRSVGSLRWLILAVGVWGCAGCEVFDMTGDVRPAAAKKLPGIKPPLNAICLDVVLVERPRGDSLVGAQLWNRVDQVQSLDPDVREELRRNGFRLGVVGTNPPRVLQQLLGEQPDFAYDEASEKAKQLGGHRFFVASGGNVKIISGPVHDECEFEVAREGESQTMQYQDAECRFRVTVEQQENGWAKMTFIPQVFHGPSQLRYVADQEWRFEDSQRVETFFDQRFALILGPGETVILAADAPEGRRLGHLFFTGQGIRASQDGEFEAMPVERLLIVRLTGTGDHNLP